MRSNYLTHIFEAMNALIAANTMPGIQDSGSSVYIVNKMNNNAFTWGMTTDYKMRHMIEKDPEDKKLKLKDVDNQDNYGFDCSTKIDSIWKVTDKAGLSEALEKIYNNLGNEVSDNFIYETLTGEKMYSMDQIEFSDKVKKITPLEDMIKAMCESIRNYTLYGKEKAELIAEVKYGDKSVSDIITEYKDTLLEFNLADSIKKIISKVKTAIYKLLTKFENTLKNVKDSRIKSLLLKAIQKLKSLFKKTDEIKSIDDANKIIEEVKEAKEEVLSFSEDSKIILKAVGDIGKRIIVADYTTFSGDLADSAVEYLKSIGMDIFESAEKYRQEKGLEIDDVEDPGNLEDIEKTNLIDLYDDIAIKFKSGEGCTKHNYDLMKKLITEYRKRPKEEVKSDWDDDLYESTILESEDKSDLDDNHVRGEQYNYKAIDLYDNECYNYFDKKEIDYYRKGNRKGEILVETDVHSAIGYIYIREIKEGNLTGNIIGPFIVFSAYRGKGYGEILLKDAIEKYNANALGVYADNKVAVELYKKVGFRIDKEMTDKKGEKFYIMRI